MGGAKFVRGLRALGRRDPARSPAITVVANTGDDLWLAGLRVTPDLDMRPLWVVHKPGASHVLRSRSKGVIGCAGALDGTVNLQGDVPSRAAWGLP